MTNFIKVKNGVASREPVPDFLPVSVEALADLSWTDPAFGLQDSAWWPEVPIAVQYNRSLQTLDGTETLTPDASLKVVRSRPNVRNLTEEERAALIPPLSIPQQLANQIEDLVVARLQRPSVFLYGYQQREAVAAAYRAAGYSGEPDEWVSSVADNAGISYSAAVDLILDQGEAMRAAVKRLESLRMGKLKVLRQATPELAQAEFDRIQKAITATPVP